MSDPKALWEVMRKAYAESSGSIINDLGQEVLSGPDREEFAAMIRVIAEEVWRRRNYSLGELRAWLQDEAIRAELGK